MRSDLRWLVAFAGNAVFLWLVSQANHHFTNLSLGSGAGSVYVLLVGLPIAFLGLRLNLRYALVAGILTALSMEAALPVPHGLIVIPSAVTICTTIAFRGTFNRFDRTSALLTALIVNLVFFVILTIAFPPASSSHAGLRLAIDLIVSQVLLCALCGWFFAWQLALMRLFGFDLETELRESP
ncbi:MAG: hypothetical protein ACREIA_02105 [Opitutaceae bacterium]